MASDGKQPFPWRDDEICVDRDGIPHYSGTKPELMKEYRRRVLFAYANLEGSGDEEAKEKKSLERKQSRFAKKLIDALHGEAWRACEELLAEPAKLREKEGYKLVFKALQSIEKVGVIFDQFFEKCYRKKGQSIDAFLRQRKKDWDDLLDLAEGIQMSEDLRAYFLLKHVNLSKDERRSILLANQSNYSMEGIEKALRISYYDIHEREKSQRDGPSSFRRFQPRGQARKNYAHQVADEDSEDPAGYQDPDGENEDDEDYAMAADEENEVGQDGDSDAGASQDSEIFEAFSAMDGQRRGYKDSRKRLRELQKARGFHKPKDAGNSEERKAMISREKQRTRCSTCGRLGHWSGDPECSQARASKGGRKGGGRSSSPSKSRGAGAKGKAYMVSEAPRFFSLDGQLDEADGYANVVLEAFDMEQDAGETELDSKRKKAQAAADGFPEDGSSAGGYLGTAEAAAPWTTMAAHDKDYVEATVYIPKTSVHYHDVQSLSEVIPADFDEMILRALQQECDRWGIATSGSKAQVKKRLEDFYKGKTVLRKGCTTKYEQLRVKNVDMYYGAASSTSSSLPLPTKTEKSKTATKDSKSAVEDSKTASRIFRSYGTATVLEGARAQDIPKTPKVLQDPPTGIVVESQLELNGAAYGLVCSRCSAHMVLRRAGSDSGLFFGCGNHFSGVCEETVKFEDGLRHLGLPYARRG